VSRLISFTGELSRVFPARECSIVLFDRVRTRRDDSGERSCAHQFVTGLDTVTEIAIAASDR
jgi:hypothetical protein